jgi:hypothetical protein
VDRIKKDRSRSVPAATYTEPYRRTKFRIETSWFEQRKVGVDISEKDLQGAAEQVVAADALGASLVRRKAIARVPSVGDAAAQLNSVLAFTDSAPWAVSARAQRTCGRACGTQRELFPEEELGSA